MSILRILYRQWFSSEVPRPAASAAPGNLKEMQTCRLPRRPTISEALGVGSSHLCFNKLSTGYFKGSKSPDYHVLHFSGIFLKEFLDIYLNK